ncbi:CcdC family protein [Bacillus sp. B1-b2]|uniref:CcdC family protein n=1 Tax=Bacillus sp. B1-b2 TaxID=2653201 RepID=UPI001D00EB17|nr:CcdC protein domain-containing protein [Bacillus sp. B1-b2]
MSVIISTLIAIVMGLFFMFVRLKAAKTPVSPKKIILPPLFMSTGSLMFLFPYFRITGQEILEAAIIGMIFSIILIKTTKFEIKGNDIYLINSKAFIYILFILLGIRIIAKIILSSTIDVGTLGGMFWFLAFCMIVPWRIAMYFNYQKLNKEIQAV